MLALFNFNGPAFPGWVKLTANEGVNVLFPQNATRTHSYAETPIGPMSCILYSGKWKDTNATSILAIRDYQPAEPLDADMMFINWKTEFHDAMQVSGNHKRLVKESISGDNCPRYDLLYSNPSGTNFTRVRLLAQGNRLIVLFAVGMLQEVIGQACNECFRSIRL